MASSRDKLRKKSQEKKQTTHTTRNNDAFDAFIEREQRKNILVDPLLKSLIPPLQEEELETLEQSIREEGVREDLMLWKDPDSISGNDFFLVDGHNRYQIIQKLEAEGVSIKYGVKILDLPSKDAVKDWMIVNQLGRRNLTNEQRSYLRGLRYEREKAKHGGERDIEASPQNGNLLRTHERLGTEYAVSKNTILRDAEFARGLEKIGAQNPTLKQEILSGKHKVKKADLQLLGREKRDDFTLDSLGMLFYTLESLKPKKLRRSVPSDAPQDEQFEVLKNELLKCIKNLQVNSSVKEIEKAQAFIVELMKRLQEKQ